MKLSVRARQALRLVCEVARRGRFGRPVKLSEIAVAAGASRPSLEQLALLLKHHSIVRGVSGRYGGYLLARPPEKITIGQVLRAVTGPIDLAPCIENPPPCTRAACRGCRPVWLLINAGVNELLDGHTVAGLLKGVAPPLSFKTILPLRGCCSPGRRAGVRNG